MATTTKTFSGITNWGEAAAEMIIEVELTDGEITGVGATINGTVNGLAVTGTAELEAVLE